MNKVILVGRLTQDPEVRYTQAGKAVTSFSLAVNKVGSSERNTADFIPIVAWEKLAEIVGNNLVKGSRCLVEGRLQIRSYADKDGQKRYKAEVVAQNVEFLDNKRHSDLNTEDPFKSIGKDVFPDEEIPF